MVSFPFYLQAKDSVMCYTYLYHIYIYIYYLKALNNRFSGFRPDFSTNLQCKSSCFSHKRRLQGVDERLSMYVHAYVYMYVYVRKIWIFMSWVDICNRCLTAFVKNLIWAWNHDPSDRTKHCCSLGYNVHHPRYSYTYLYIHIVFKYITRLLKYIHLYTSLYICKCVTFTLLLYSYS